MPGSAPARAHGLYSECNSIDDLDQLEQLILTVDCSRAALMALLVHEECGAFEHRCVLHDTRLSLACL